MALEGVKVVDLSQLVAVPMAARILADFGADVLHIEHPRTGDLLRGLLEGLNPSSSIKSQVNYIWEHYNRDKKSVTIDLSQEGGQETLYKMLETADVFLTNMRPYELEKFRLEYDILNRLNPRLVAGYLTGYGKKGPERDAPAYDQTGYWGKAGVTHRFRSLLPALQEPGANPHSFMPAFGDQMASMTLACGIITALFARERTGLGDEVNTSLFSAGVYQISFDISGTLVAGQDCNTMTSREEIPNPLFGQYQTKDGRWMIFCVLYPDRYWSRFCRTIGREDLEHDPRFESFEVMKENNVALMEILDELFLSKTLDEWIPIINEAGVPWSPVQNLLEVINDPQARANDFFVSYDHPAYGRIEGVANPIRIGKNPNKVRMPGPEFSQHTEEVLLEHGYTREDIVRFKDQGIIA